MNIEEKVKDILKELSGMEISDTSLCLQEHLGLDSFLLVSLLVEIENKFNIELQEQDMNPFELIAVSDVIEMVSRYE